MVSWSLSWNFQSSKLWYSLLFEFQQKEGAALVERDWWRYICWTLQRSWRGEICSQIALAVKWFSRHVFLTQCQTAKPATRLLLIPVSCWRRLLNSWHHEFVDENDLHQSLLVKLAMNNKIMDFFDHLWPLTDIDRVVPLQHSTLLLPSWQVITALITRRLRSLGAQKEASSRMIHTSALMGR